MRNLGAVNQMCMKFGVRVKMKYWISEYLKLILLLQATTRDKDQIIIICLMGMNLGQGTMLIK